MVFDREGGTLGRALGNHFALPDADRAVSGTHALIRYAHGRYSLEDTSANGTFISTKNLTLHRKSVQLDDGDRLKIGDYDLVVAITEKPGSGDGRILESTNDPPYTAPAAGLPPDFDLGALLNGLEGVEQHRAEAHSPKGDNVSPQSAAFAPPSLGRASEPAAGLPPDFDLGAFLNGLEGVEQHRAEAYAPEEDNVSPQSAAFAPPSLGRVPAQRPPLPSDLALGGRLDGPEEAGDLRATVASTAWAAPQALGVPADKAAGATPPLPLSTPATSVAPTHNEDVFRVFLEGAGLQDAPVFHQAEIPALLRTAGALLREAIVGLGTMLHGRATSLCALHTAVTTMHAAQHNPLKDAVPDEVLTRLLTHSHPGALDGVEAVRAGCAELIHHELALTAGIQAAVSALLERLDPQQVAQPYAEGMVWQRKAKCWDAYSQAYKKVVAEVREDVFGEAFVRAYEAQMGKLRSQDHTR